MDLIKKLDNLPKKVTIPVLGISIEELNDINEKLDEDGFEIYDPSLEFRDKIIWKYKTVKIIQLNAVYYQDWTQFKQWSAIVENKKGKFIVTTSHGWMKAKKYV